MERRAEIEELLARLNAGDESVRDTLFRHVYEELHAVARSEMARQAPGHTLQATALINETYLKLAKVHGAPLDRAHFIRLASRAMRQVLVDHARRKSRQKRSATGERVELDGIAAEYERRSGGMIALDEALNRLKTREPELVHLVELRFFGGQDMREVANALGISERSAQRRWQAARLYLRKELGRG